MNQSLVNESLDSIALMIVDCYDEILKERTLLNSCLDDAYLNLSKARSLIGCASLSILQVPSEIEPNVTIDEKETEEQIDENLNYKQMNYDLVIKNKQKLKSTEDETTTQVVGQLPTWFGVLTPLSLKTSHKSFSQSLYTIKTICELQSKLNGLQILYSDLKKQIV